MKYMIRCFTLSVHTSQIQINELLSLPIQVNYFQIIHFLKLLSVSVYRIRASYLKCEI